MAKSVKTARHGPTAPFYEPAIREIVDRGDVARMKLLLKEAKLCRKRFGNIDAAIANLERAIKKLG